MLNRRYISFFIFLLVLSFRIALDTQGAYGQTKNQNLASTPPMGWNSWNSMQTDVNAKSVKAIADAMVNSGMKDAGYEYIIIDDGWMTEKRDKSGHIIVDSTKFPSGIKPVADYVHSLGLKFGIYSTPSRYTCAKLMGSFGHEQIDANDYAKWGVDFLKYDQCYLLKEDNESQAYYKERCQTAFEIMKKALERTGRPIVYSTNDRCAGRDTKNNDLPWIKGLANMHRTSEDIKDNWDRMLYCLETSADLWMYAGEGYWNDPDMLEVGNTSKENVWGNISSKKMDLTEYQTHFSMWCMLAAPLIAGNNLRTMKPEIKEILTNKEMIDIDQDSLGKQGRRIKVQHNVELWLKELSHNRLAAAVFNKGDTVSSMSIEWKRIGIDGEVAVRDVWEHKNLGVFSKSIQVKKVKSHEARIFLLTPKYKK